MQTNREWSEKQLTNKLISHLNKQPSAWVYKRHAISNEAGKPDITGIYKGLRVEIEVKAPCRDRGSLTANLRIASKIQQHYIKKIQKLGGIAGVVCTVDQADNLLRSFD